MWKTRIFFSICWLFSSRSAYASSHFPQSSSCSSIILEVGTLYSFWKNLLASAHSRLARGMSPYDWLNCLKSNPSSSHSKMNSKWSLLRKWQKYTYMNFLTQTTEFPCQMWISWREPGIFHCIWTPTELAFLQVSELPPFQLCRKLFSFSIFSYFLFTFIYNTQFV